MALSLSEVPIFIHRCVLRHSRPLDFSSLHRMVSPRLFSCTQMVPHGTCTREYPLGVPSHYPRLRPQQPQRYMGRCHSASVACSQQSPLAVSTHPISIARDPESSRPRTDLIPCPLGTACAYMRQRQHISLSNLDAWRDWVGMIPLFLFIISVMKTILCLVAFLIYLIPSTTLPHLYL